MSSRLTRPRRHRTAILAAVLAVLVIADVVQVWMILVLAFLLGIANAVDMPARQSFAYEMVGRTEVSSAVALNSAMFNGARVLGPAAAGLAIGAFGVGPAFAINALSFVAVIVGLAMMEPSARVPGLPDLYYAQRVKSLVEKGLLLAEGNLSSMRYSEVRLAQAP